MQIETRRALTRPSPHSCAEKCEWGSGSWRWNGAPHHHHHHYSNIYPSSSSHCSQTGARRPCDTTIRPPTHRIHSLLCTITHTHTHTRLTRALFFFLYVCTPQLPLHTLPARIRIPLRIVHSRGGEGPPAQPLPPTTTTAATTTIIAAKQSMNSSSQLGRIIHAGTREHRADTWWGLELALFLCCWRSLSGSFHLDLKWPWKVSLSQSDKRTFDSLCLHSRGLENALFWPHLECLNGVFANLMRHK